MLVERHLSVRRVAALLDFHKRTVWRLIARGEFPGVCLLSGRTRIPEAEVHAYIERGKLARSAGRHHLPTKSD
jgi:excisionase family DNA binding protein